MVKWVVLASGSGSLIELVSQKCSQGVIKAEVAAVVTDRQNKSLAQRADKISVPCHTIIYPGLSGFDEWDENLLDVIQKYSPDHILLLGFLRRIGPRLLSAYPHRIFNTHPSLLPKFGGKGMYGSNVHMAVAAAGERETGVTFHLVNDVYDSGIILRQARIDLPVGVSATEVEALVRQLEREELVDYLKAVAMTGNLVAHSHF